jgi:hypothetical protein
MVWACMGPRWVALALQQFCIFKVETGMRWENRQS